MKCSILTGASLFLAAFASSGVIAAEATQAVGYEYGMPLDVARVISIDEPNPLSCETVQAKMTYVDSKGEQKSVTYLKQSSACANS
ncbi:DUF2790 domain-containing protein [Metapseudomonas boanensis]|uniref:DUF2790 domain-containing protein n=1 Tax=Metapseudomonas boanensis TaxID=2822138 RepID=A0ABS5XNV3_9GAMM|nr:DUF2790 domain-containing protein [Pseudomonas boanensis]MBT8769383.1 DUF2790 domain-containing protein [Pseudomonas boanensis]